MVRGLWEVGGANTAAIQTPSWECTTGCCLMPCTAHILDKLDKEAGKMQTKCKQIKQEKGHLISPKQHYFFSFIYSWIYFSNKDNHWPSTAQVGVMNLRPKNMMSLNTANSLILGSCFFFPFLFWLTNGSHSLASSCLPCHLGPAPRPLRASSRWVQLWDLPSSGRRIQEVFVSVRLCWKASHLSSVRPPPSTHCLRLDTPTHTHTPAPAHPADVWWLAGFFLLLFLYTIYISTAASLSGFPVTADDSGERHYGAGEEAGKGKYRK